MHRDRVLISGVVVEPVGGLEEIHGRVGPAHASKGLFVGPDVLTRVDVRVVGLGEGGCGERDFAFDLVDRVSYPGLEIVGDGGHGNLPFLYAGKIGVLITVSGGAPKAKTGVGHPRMAGSACAGTYTQSI